MKKLRLAVAVLALFAVSANAERGSKGSWEFGPYVGMLFPDDYAPFNLDKALLAGGRLGYFVTSRISVPSRKLRVEQKITSTPVA